MTSAKEEPQNDEAVVAEEPKVKEAEQAVALADLPITQLKVLAYDELSLRDYHQNRLNQLNQEIARRQNG